MHKFTSVVAGLVIVAVSVGLAILCGDFTQSIIHMAGLPLPTITLDTELIASVLLHLLGPAIVAFGIAALLFPQGLFDTAERTAKQVYIWGAAWGVGSLYYFLTSSDVFPHHILVGAFVIAVMLLWLGYGLFGRDRAEKGRHSLPGRLLAVVLATFRLLLRPWTWLAVLLTLAPLIATVFYVVSQDFRDSVAEYRVRHNASVKGDWITVPINTRTKLLQPIMIRPEPGHPNRLIVLERAGRLFRMGYPDDGTKELLLDISATVGEVNLENGALGFDFDPRYSEDGRHFVYLYFTSYTPEKQVNYLSRFDLSAPDAAARTATRFDLMALNRPPSQYHNAGHVEVGHDGFLYLSIGEMDLDETYQQRVDRSLVAGIFRIDVLNQGGDISRPIEKQPEDGKTQGYFIPKDNPFASVPGALGEYYALGLRNPFRFDIDKDSGLIWTGDVGSTTWEEVNAVTKGGNYQFPYNEGGLPTDFAKPADVVGTETGPVYTYHHTAYDRSVIGGTVYRGARWPGLNGKYVFGDNYSGKLWAIPLTGEKVTEVETLGQADKYAQRGLTSFVRAADDRLLITVMGSSSAPNGEIVELVPRSAGKAASLGGGQSAAAATEQVTDATVRESYVTNCARCHGEEGRGDGPDAAMLANQFGTRPTNFRTAEFKARPRQEILKAIRQGGEAVGRSAAMPPWTGILENVEIDAIAKYVMAFPAESGDRQAPKQ